MSTLSTDTHTHAHAHTHSVPILVTLSDSSCRASVVLIVSFRSELLFLKMILHEMANTVPEINHGIIIMVYDILHQYIM